MMAHGMKPQFQRRSTAMKLDRIRRELMDVGKQADAGGYDNRAFTDHLSEAIDQIVFAYNVLARELETRRAIRSQLEEAR